MLDGGAPARPRRSAGLLVEPMAAPGLELIVGLRRDPLFGPAVLVGLGGILAEVLDDVAIRLAPVTPRAAMSMLDDLRGRRLLDGVRGRPGHRPRGGRRDARRARAPRRSSARTCSRSTSTRSSRRRPGALAVDALVVLEEGSDAARD